MTRTRRSPVELREAILRAAEEAFSHGGYGAVTLKDVAAEAGVAESVLYRHFPSKSVLFREAVLQPLMTFLESFSEASGRYQGYALDDRTLMRVTVGSLLDQLGDHRAALRSVTAAEDDLSQEDREELHRELADVLVRMGDISRGESGRRKTDDYGLGIEMTGRMLVGMIISLVVHEQWLLRDLPNKPTRADVLDHLVEMMLRASGASTE